MVKNLLKKFRIKRSAKADKGLKDKMEQFLKKRDREMKNKSL